MIKATVSGSFHRHMHAIYTAVSELRGAGVNVLSPSDPRIVGYLREFLFVASDKTRLKRQVQQRHFEAITNSDFLWLVCPDGYVGISAAMEMGWALRSSVPVFSDTKPADVTAEDFVNVVTSISDAIAITSNMQRTRRSRASILLDPADGARSVIRAAEESEAILSGRAKLTDADANRLLRHHAETVRGAFSSLTE